MSLIELAIKHFVEPLKAFGIMFTPSAETTLPKDIVNTIWRLIDFHDLDINNIDYVKRHIILSSVKACCSNASISYEAKQHNDRLFGVPFFNTEVVKKYNAIFEKGISGFFEDIKFEEAKLLFKTLYGLSTPSGEKLPVYLIAKIINYDTGLKWSP